MPGMSKKTSVAKAEWVHSTAEAAILMTYCGSEEK
ncbi:MAG: hypothetical protein BWY74_01709 [Firmicutes bacterium ADurb.Bin419]|nr:MAG: hypothetical protein BWY74_01709 [Firmicutes bacterium ADurb.Bin419]